jgi:hypothetical protein
MASLQAGTDRRRAACPQKAVDEMKQLEARRGARAAERIQRGRPVSPMALATTRRGDSAGFSYVHGNQTTSAGIELDHRVELMGLGDWRDDRAPALCRGAALWDRRGRPTAQSAV